MRLVVVPGTEPDHIERLGIIAVMRVHSEMAAKLAAEALELAVAHGAVEPVMRSSRYRVVDAPPFCKSARQSPSVRHLLPGAVVGADAFVLAPVRA
jgi:hypothetical protein